ncbi:DNA polymerase [Rhizobium sp. Root274]|uniref:UdgX family uracil-DNA binding protein n=1 Tax=unclassified Rhizobium TaxID=2613769 RepID=UPI000713F593|nr:MULTISPECIES: UdgX family uracil-DNA binding protein [unclassified Rhizobium]KQW28931.1 DNA polymerase [Rhizobium sp. Root1240]KRD29127.1 DNA polymerase [Rhizobium sp. Root274]
MRQVMLKGRGDFAEWRHAARALLAGGVPPQDVLWQSADGGGDLFGLNAAVESYAGAAAGFSVPKGFLEAAEAAICHSDPARFRLLYRLLWRIEEERSLLEVTSDPDVSLLRVLIKNVRRDSHKMKAFVRFREVPGMQKGRRRVVAWFEPDHFIVARTAGFFQRRFTDMDWLIATPKGAAAWDGEVLQVSTEPAARPEAEDETDGLWQTYFANIFNPARVKIRAMQSEMPKKYWKNMPEAALIPDLIAGAERRVAEMAARAASQPPAFHERLQKAWRAQDADEGRESLTPLETLRREAAGCTLCPLHCHATQTVFGEGAEDAEVMFVGEQPGDTEDLAGRPFVGPAGRVFDEAISLAGIKRDGVYVTNAVKHFKHERRGKRRIHMRPEAGEVAHCRWWLAKELDVVKPKVVVALGATAYLALTGEAKPIAEVRGMPIPMQHGMILFVTTHPAAILRMPDEALKARSLAVFRSDLADVARLRASLQA